MAWHSEIMMKNYSEIYVIEKVSVGDIEVVNDAVASISKISLLTYLRNEK